MNENEPGADALAVLDTWRHHVKLTHRPMTTLTPPSATLSQRERDFQEV
jgi:hypothetical protein